TLSPTYSICRDHGYLAGEVKSCPHCGKKTEIYSRITGYYRPVQNWNDGKLQEYKNRVEYDIENSCLKRPTSAIVTVSGLENEEAEIEFSQPEEVRYLFTTKKCPNCKQAKEILKNIPYILMDAEENPELAYKYKVRQAPTLVVVNKDQVWKYANLSNIMQYAQQTALVGV
nr:ribonucleoside triphosphate reductase [Lachnospiraceae bacterium]